jgi:hypothetical protein
MKSFTLWAKWNAFVEGPLESVNIILETGYEGTIEEKKEVQLEDDMEELSY